MLIFPLFSVEVRSVLQGLILKILKQIQAAVTQVTPVMRVKLFVLTQLIN